MTDDEVRALLYGTTPGPWTIEQNRDANGRLAIAAPELAAEVLRRGEIIATYETLLDKMVVVIEPLSPAERALLEGETPKPLTPSEQAVIDGGGSLPGRYIVGDASDMT